ncbi:MAG TPA: hypothetical protein VFA24_05980 [Gaiellaceae bacterium]|nr:hypothetical protein [Gaiellaceae bacterium]
MFALRSPRFALVVVATLAAAGAAAAAGYSLTAPKRYRATAELMVSPVPAADSTYAGIDVLRDGSGKRTAVETAAVLVRSPLVADAVRALVGSRRSRESLLHALDAHVVGASNVVAVTVEDTSPDGAAQLANAFVDTLINQRSATFQSQVAAAVRRYSQQLGAIAPGDRQGQVARELSRRLAVLRPLQGQPDPSLAHAGQATAPAEAAWPHTGRLTLLGAGIGAALGLAAAAALALLRSRPRPRPGTLDADPHAAAVRARAFDARERDLQKKIDELKSAHAEVLTNVEDLSRREHELTERVAVVTTRERELAKRAAELAVRREIVAAPAPELAPPAAAPADGSAGRYNLDALERLVQEQAARYPERAEEWASYLFFLRDYADADGALPARFDWLVQEAFAPLVS